MSSQILKKGNEEKTATWQNSGKERTGVGVWHGKHGGVNLDRIRSLCYKAEGVNCNMWSRNGQASSVYSRHCV